MGSLTVKGVKALANANYNHGGDYLLTMLSDSEMEDMFCVPVDGKRRVYAYMRSAEEMRCYAAGLL